MTDISQQPIGIFGGTFDPIHLGHLYLANQIYQRLSLQEIRFIPAYRPVHRATPAASPQDRLNMVKIAIAGTPYFKLDDREISRDGKSYMIDTLISLRQSYPDMPLCLILSMDVFADFEKWHRWEEIINYAHIIVGKRPGYDLINSATLLTWLKPKEIKNPELLQHKLAGYVLMLEFPTLPISATQIRDLIAKGENPGALLTPGVWDYIQEHKLYSHRE